MRYVKCLVELPPCFKRGKHYKLIGFMTTKRGQCCGAGARHALAKFPAELEAENGKLAFCPHMYEIVDR